MIDMLSADYYQFYGRLDFKIVENSMAGCY